MPIARAVEISGDQHAGSNSAARHARGVEGLTIRPLAQALPPDSEWVDVRYRTQAGDVREDRFAWETFKLPSDDEGFVAEGAVLAGLASVGVDHERDMIRRATKKLYVPDVLDRQKQHRETEFPYPSFATIPSPGGRTAGGARGTSARRRRSGETPVRPHGLPYGAFSARDLPSRDFADREDVDRDEPNRDSPNATLHRRAFARWRHLIICSRHVVFPSAGSRSTTGRTAATSRWWMVVRVAGKRLPMPAGRPSDSFLPQVFNAYTVPVGETSYGHIRIRTFQCQRRMAVPERVHPAAGADAEGRTDPRRPRQRRRAHPRG